MTVRQSRKRPRKPRPAVEPSAAAKAAALRYVSDERPGITRSRRGSGFVYRNVAGKLIRDSVVLGRIRALAIPPAWTDVWICPLENGHLQATGRDARGRKQYRYHNRWREVRDETKYARLAQFAGALPRIRARVRRDLALPGVPRNKVLAMIVRLMEVTGIRVGNEEYVKQNGSYGLTTLRNRHVDVRGPTIRFLFRGKSGKEHSLELTNRRLARFVKRCRDLPGQDLFQYLDDRGRPRPIGSGDVNDYLREVSGEDFTAKDFRTWAGTVVAAEQLVTLDPPGNKTQINRGRVKLIKAVAERLGNTPAVCRKSYIHPLVLEAYGDAGARRELTSADQAGRPGLKRFERAIVRFLQSRQRTLTAQAKAG